uniref:NACHT and WD repeat domain-containing protein 2-like n=1 Tax=Castor canadensis TaxID=51338 RepID=A0A8B7UZS7_CASCN|nr:NACHT and WD repeat domain-containing protein 2-like [Castor canadensis]
MWPAGAGTKLPCPRDSALRRAAFSGNLTALPSHLVPAGRSVRVFISANPEGHMPVHLLAELELYLDPGNKQVSEFLGFQTINYKRR